MGLFVSICFLKQAALLLNMHALWPHPSNTPFIRDDCLLKLYKGSGLLVSTSQTWNKDLVRRESWRPSQRALAGKTPLL